MHRTDGANHVGNMHQDGNPTIPTPGTTVTADLMNALQEEIVGVVLESGASLSKPDNTQLLTALNAMYGRKAAANTWTDVQTFSGDVELNGYVGANGPITSTTQDETPILQVANPGNTYKLLTEMELTANVFHRTYLMTSPSAGWLFTYNARWAEGTSDWRADDESAGAWYVILGSAEISKYGASSPGVGNPLSFSKTFGIP